MPQDEAFYDFWIWMEEIISNNKFIYRDMKGSSG